MILQQTTSSLHLQHGLFLVRQLVAFRLEPKHQLPLVSSLPAALQILDLPVPKSCKAIHYKSFSTGRHILLVLHLWRIPTNPEWRERSRLIRCQFTERLSIQMNNFQTIYKNGTLPHNQWQPAQETNPFSTVRGLGRHPAFCESDLPK